jgi:hypothetical protein
VSSVIFGAMPVQDPSSAVKNDIESVVFGVERLPVELYKDRRSW